MAHHYNPTKAVMYDSEHALDGKTLVLTADDRAGIEWLYRHHVEKSLKAKDCLDGYVYVEGRFAYNYLLAFLNTQ